MNKMIVVGRSVSIVEAVHMVTVPKLQIRSIAMVLQGNADIVVHHPLDTGQRALIRNTKNNYLSLP